ncbi:MAG: UvrD-helicase domain-containing protein [Deltaproteobacteria bacterium]|nr:UvrD-helicase domain-containing protein [Deltaproteobacteria bacterium]
MSPTQRTLVSAGAGTGKTHWIVEHIASLVLSGVAIERVVAVTFTEAAAAELEARLRARLQRAGASDLAARVSTANVSTIHRFSLELIRRYPTSLGLSPDPLVLNARTSRTLQDRAIDDALEAAETSSLQRALALFGPAFGLSERGFGDNETPGGRLRWAIADLLEKSQSLAMTPDALRASVDQTLGHLLGAFPPAQSIDRLDAKLIEADAAARAFVSAKSAAPTKKDQLLYDLLARYPAPTSREECVALGIALASSSIDCSQKFREGADLLQISADYCARHPAIREALETSTRALFALAATTLARFDEEKRRLGAVDFNDMQRLALALVEGSAPADQPYAALIASTLDWIVVDEFQDSAPIQFRLFDSLYSHGVKMALVGDVKQAIYRFRGADSSLFAALIDQHRPEDGERVSLDRSRRSRPELVQFANELFAPLFAREKLPFEPLTALNDYTDRPVDSLLSCVEIVRYPSRDSANAKAHAVARRIQDLIAGKLLKVRDRATQTDRPARWSDVTILARKHSHLAKWAAILQLHGIDAALADGPLFETLEAQLALAWLRMVASPRDVAASASVLVSEVYGLSQVTVALLLARGISGSPAFALELTETDPAFAAITQREREALARCADDLRWSRRLFRTTPLGEAIDGTLARIELAQRLGIRCEAAVDRAQISANIQAFSEIAHDLAASDERALSLRPGDARTIEAVILELEALRDANTTQPNAELTHDAVRLMTLHAAKGLEFAWVVVDALGEEISPTLPRLEVAKPERSEDYTGHDSLTKSSLLWIPHLGMRELGDMLAESYDAIALERAESLRLLYVAVTRARDHLTLLWPEETKTPSKRTLLRDVITDRHARPPSVGGESLWLLGEGSSAHRVSVTHAVAPEKPEDSLEDSTLQTTTIHLKQVLDDAVVSTEVRGLEHAENPLARALTLSPSLLTVLNDCPEVRSLSALYPDEHRIARTHDTLLKTTPIRSTRRERVAIRLIPHSELGTWLHRAACRPDALLDDKGALAAAAWLVEREASEEPEREEIRTWISLSLASIREAIATLGTVEQRAHELAFVVPVASGVLRGSVDLVLQTSTGLHILDFKSHLLEASSYSNNAGFYAPQLDAYAYATSQMTGKRIVGRHLILPSSGVMLTLDSVFEPGLFETQAATWSSLEALQIRGPQTHNHCNRCAWAPLCVVPRDSVTIDAT